ncbi:MAG: hypothetical protein IPK32_24055 [Verrucomicrobiaceae bacterium]|nr:hypothetical protein [Verrucomicrobiaceae bacterium]
MKHPPSSILKSSLIRVLCTLLTAALGVSCQNKVNAPQAAAQHSPRPVPTQETQADHEHFEGQLTDAMRTLVPGYNNQPITYTTPHGRRTFTPKK